jgi:hypothetical protein
MVKARHIEPFYLVVKDMDKGVFTVVGPMTDDTSWTHRICQAQDAGRQVTCYTAGRGQSKAQIIGTAERELGLQYINENVI